MAHHRIIGWIDRPKGLHGEVLARIFPEYEPLIQKGLLLRVRDECLKVTEARRDRKRWVLAFEGKASLDHVEALRGGDLAVKEEFLPPLQEDEFYARDLVGLRALDNQGRAYGTVVRVIHPHNMDILIVQGDEKKEYLVPLLSTYIHKISLEERVVVFDPSCLP